VIYYGVKNVALMVFVRVIPMAFISFCVRIACKLDLIAPFAFNASGYSFITPYINTTTNYRYAYKGVPQLVATLHALLDASPTSQVIVAHECRPYVTDFGDWKYGELTRKPC
jgi:hypothetical protein